MSELLGGGLHALPRTASSCIVASALEESVSIDAALRGVKKLRVVTLGGVSTATDATAATDFFDVGAALLVLCRLRLRISWKPSSCVAAGFGVVRLLGGRLQQGLKLP
jgi:hypothetical protein